MKKTITVIFIFSMLLCVLFSGCNGKKQLADTQDYSVTLSEKTAVLPVYGKLELTATVTGDEGTAAQDVAVNWSSSDPNVAQVADGVVFAKGEGQAEITAMLENNEIAVCKVIVEKKGIIPQLAISNVANNQLTIANGQTYHLASIVSFGGQDSTDPDTIFAYQVTDSSVATVSDAGVITAQKQGTTQIIVTASWRGMGGDSLAGGEDAYGLRIVIDLTVVNP